MYLFQLITFEIQDEHEEDIMMNFSTVLYITSRFTNFID